VLGLLGLLFFWLVPRGILVAGAGIVLSVLVLAFDIDMATGGLTRLLNTRLLNAGPAAGQESGRRGPAPPTRPQATDVEG
jgi:hypothetical protein